MVIGELVANAWRSATGTERTTFEFRNRAGVGFGSGGRSAILVDVGDQPVHLVDLALLCLDDVLREFAHSDISISARSLVRIAIE